MTQAGDKVLAYLGLRDNAQIAAQVEKFIRCNGALGALDAAHETASILKSGSQTIHDPWAYCIGVHNGNVARAATLFPLLHLLENSLRARVDFFMAQSLGSAWYQNPNSYLKPSDANVVRSDSATKGVQDRSGGVSPYPIMAFATGTDFLVQVPFWVLEAIINNNIRLRLRFLFTAERGRPPIAPTRVESLLQDIHISRNEIAHHRGIPRTLYASTAAGLQQILEALEFDVGKATQHVQELVSDYHKVFPAVP